MNPSSNYVLNAARESRIQHAVAKDCHTSARRSDFYLWLTELFSQKNWTQVESTACLRAHRPHVELRVRCT